VKILKVLKMNFYLHLFMLDKYMELYRQLEEECQTCPFRFGGCPFEKPDWRAYFTVALGNAGNISLIITLVMLFLNHPLWLVFSILTIALAFLFIIIDEKKLLYRRWERCPKPLTM